LEPEPYGLEDDEVQKRLNELRDPDCAFRMDCKGLGLEKLTDKTFDTFISTHDKAFVIFHLDVSTRAVHALLSFSEAVLGNKIPRIGMAELPCHDWTDVCQKQGVFTWPTLRVYEHGKFLTDYKGVWDTKAIATFIQNFKDVTPVPLQTVRDVETFIRGDNMDRENRVQRVTLGLFERYEDTECLKFVEVARNMRGRAVTGVVTGAVAEQVMRKYFPEKQLPAIVTVATGVDGTELMEPSFFCTKISLEKFITKSQAMGVLEMTTENFPKTYQLNLPVAVLIGCPRSLPKVMPAFTRAAKMLKDKVAFTYLNTKVDTQLADIVTRSFHINDADTPAIVLTTPERGQACIFRKQDLNGLTEDTLARTLENCANGRGDMTVKLPTHDWTNRIPMYDYYSQYYNLGAIKSDTTPRPIKTEL
jgi:hypothetical protein